MLVQHHKSKDITPSLGCLTIFVVHGHLDDAWYKKAHYRLQTKLRKGNVFTSMCQEFCSQGGGVHQAPWADTPPGQTHPGQTPPPDRHPPGRRLLQWTVRILLECILVSRYLLVISWNNWEHFVHELLLVHYRPFLYLRYGFVSRISYICGHKVGSNRIHQKYGGRFSIVLTLSVRLMVHFKWTLKKIRLCKIRVVIHLCILQ